MRPPADAPQEIRNLSKDRSEIATELAALAAGTNADGMEQSRAFLAWEERNASRLARAREALHEMLESVPSPRVKRPAVPDSRAANGEAATLQSELADSLAEIVADTQGRSPSRQVETFLRWEEENADRRARLLRKLEESME